MFSSLVKRKQKFKEDSFFFRLHPEAHSTLANPQFNESVFAFSSSVRSEMNSIKPAHVHFKQCRCFPPHLEGTNLLSTRMLLSFPFSFLKEKKTTPNIHGLLLLLLLLF